MDLIILFTAVMNSVLVTRGVEDVLATTGVVLFIGETEVIIGVVIGYIKEGYK